jgi:hypothetical protein
LIVNVPFRVAAIEGAEAAKKAAAAMPRAALLMIVFISRYLSS